MGLGVENMWFESWSWETGGGKGLHGDGGGEGESWDGRRRTSKLRRHQKAIAKLATSDNLIYAKIKLKIPFNNNF